MEIFEINPKEYSEIITEPYFCYGLAAFNELNKYKVDRVHYLLFKEGKYRLGLIGGQKGDCLLSPFSAPFGGFLFLKEYIRISYIEDAIDCLIKWAVKEKIKEIIFTLPPSIYNETFISKQINCLYRKEFRIRNIDLNYFFQTSKFENYTASVWRNARKNHNIATSGNLSLIKCESFYDKKTAYDIIELNRKAKGYPLKMTWDQVAETISIINSDFFLVLNNDKIPVAASIIFHVTPDIVQVIYWGDLPEYTSLKTMNYLSYKIFEYYFKTGIKNVDIGPSTENSLPNYGLCEFKESIGSDICTKFSMVKTISNEN